MRDGSSCPLFAGPLQLAIGTRTPESLTSEDSHHVSVTGVPVHFIRPAAPSEPVGVPVQGSGKKALGLVYDLADVGEQLSSRETRDIQPSHTIGMFDPYPHGNGRILLWA